MKKVSVLYMGDFGDKRNAEGYHDPTPYQAIKNMIKPGEIWTFQKKDNTEAEVLVVAFSDNVATILYLMDEYKEGCIPVRFGDFDFVNPRMLNWSWGGFLNKCVRKLSVQEFAAISVEIEKVLSVKIQREAVVTVNPNEVTSLKCELDCLRRQLDEAEKRAVELSDQLSMTQIENTKQKAQNATLKEMYSDLMEKYLQRA